MHVMIVNTENVIDSVNSFTFNKVMINATAANIVIYQYHLLVQENYAQLSFSISLFVVGGRIKPLKMPGF